MKYCLIHCYSDLNKGDLGIILSTVERIRLHDDQATIRIPFQNNSSFTWDGLDQKGQPSPTGLYLVSISNGKTVHSRKVTLLK